MRSSWYHDRSAVFGRRQAIRFATAVLLLAVVVFGCECDDELVLLSGSLSGQLCSDLGTPLEGIEVTAVAADGTDLTGVTDHAGYYELEDIPPGAVEISATVDGDERQFSAQVEPSKHAEVTDPWCDIVPPPPPPLTGGVEGCLCDQTGEAWIANAEVTISSNGAVYPTTTDPDGCLQVDGIQVGTATVSTADQGLGYSQEIEVEEGARAVLSSPTFCEPCRLTLEFVPGSATSVTDIVWIVDNSGSMEYEERIVQDALSDWSQRIADSGIDHRVVLLSDVSNIEIPPPLGGSPHFLHVDATVDSENGLLVFLDRYDDFHDFLRDGSIKHVVMVTDDNSELPAADFQQRLADLSGAPWGTPGEDWFFHSIVGTGNIPNIGCVTAAHEGDEYITLTQETGGVLAQICQRDWDTIFDALEAAVREWATGCSAPVPEPTDDYTIDFADVSLSIEAGAGDLPLLRVENINACTASGWYLESESKIVVCSAACDHALTLDEGRFTAAIGCTWRQ